MSDVKIKGMMAKAVLTGPISADDARSQVEKLNATLPEIDQARKWIEEYGDMGDHAELEILEAKIRSSLALLENYLATGVWEGPAAGEGDGSVDGEMPTDPTAESLFTLTPGWNGNVIVRQDTAPGYEDAASLAEGEFQGFVYIDDDGNPATQVRIALQASATTKEIRAFNRGNDIVYVETYLDENGAEQKRFWVGIGHVTNTRAEIAIDAHTAQDKINIDFSRTLRISDGSGLAPKNTVGGFVIIGSDNDDTIVGSQGDDRIYGLKGSDFLYGLGGRDAMYGDDWNEWAQSRGTMGLPTDLPDGDDTIDGGEGGDAIEGGGGINKGFKTDKANKTHIQHELESGGAALDRSAWLGADTRGFEVDDEIPGEVVITETGDGPNVLDLKIPDGYSMAYATPDGTSLKITFVKEARDGGAPQTLTLTIKDALNDRRDSLASPFTLILNGNGEDNIVDFHEVPFGNNNFVTRGMENRDMVLKPKMDLEVDGLTVEDLKKTSLSTREANALVEKVIPDTGSDEDQPWVSARLNANKEIEVTSADSEGSYNPPFTLHVDPQDFEKAYVYRDPASAADSMASQDLLIVLVKKNIDGETTETLVIRVKNFDNNFGTPGQNGADVFRWLKFEHSVEPVEAGSSEKPQLGGSIDVIPLNIVSF